MTLAQVLKGRAMPPAWWASGISATSGPTICRPHRGFDEYLGIPYSNDMRPVRLLEGDKEVEYPVVQATLTRRYTERALRFIEQNRDRPFFLYFAHAMPHKPLACSEAFYKKSGAGLYGDVLAELDWSVGQVLARLKELGLDDSTLVLFTSDNGPWFGGSTGGLRGMKSTTWEGGFRVPCIARWPGRLPAGTVCRCAGRDDGPVRHRPGRRRKYRHPQDRVIDGKNLLPLLSGKVDDVHDVIFGQQGPRWRRCATPAGSCTCCRPANARATQPAGAGSTRARPTA